MLNRDNFKYIGLATQLLAALGVAFFIGYKADAYIGWKFPVLMLLLPILVFIVLVWHIVKDTSKKGKKNDKK